MFMSAASDVTGGLVRSGSNTRCSHWIARSAFGLALVCAPVSPLSATTQGIQFTSQVSAPNACTIVVIRDGDFGVSADKKILSSKIAGGLSAIADVISGRNYRVTAEAPTGFNLGPSNAALNTVFEARFSGVSVSRGRDFAERNGSVAERLRGGASTTRVTMHLVATRTGSTFPSGIYEGTVVLRCE